MARLIIEAIGEDVTAAAGNFRESVILVSVTNSNGVGVTGLNLSNFVLDSMIVATGGAISSIDSLMTNITGSITGIYIFRIAPFAGQTWKSGVYVWALKVTSGANVGQTLCSTLID